MNKSKFLKRSLAALLAILMVATMIPSVFAAGEDAPEIFVDNRRATYDGTKDYAVTIYDTDDVLISWTPKAGVKMQVVTRHNVVKDLDAKIYLPENAAFDGKDTYTIILRKTEGKDAPVDCTLSITIKSTKPANNCNLGGVRVDKTNGWYKFGYLGGTAVKGYSNELTGNGFEAHAISGDITGNKVVVTLPFGMTPADVGFGATITGTAKSTAVFAPESVVAKSLYTYNSTTKTGKVTVTAQSGATRTYDVVFKSEKVFDDFTGATNREDLEDVSKISSYTALGGSVGAKYTLKVNVPVADPSADTAAYSWTPVFVPTKLGNVERAQRIMGVGITTEDTNTNPPYLALQAALTGHQEELVMANGAAVGTDATVRLVTSGHATWTLGTTTFQNTNPDYVYLLVRTKANPSGAFVEVELNPVQTPAGPGPWITEVQAASTMSDENAAFVAEDATSINVTLSQDYGDFNAGAGDTQKTTDITDVTLHISTHGDAHVRVPSQENADKPVVSSSYDKGAAASDRHVLQHVNAKDGRVTIQISDEDFKNVKNYTVNFRTATSNKTELDRVALVERKADGTMEVIAESVKRSNSTAPRELEVPFSYFPTTAVDDQKPTAGLSGVGTVKNLYLFVTTSDGGTVIPGRWNKDNLPDISTNMTEEDWGIEHTDIGSVRPHIIENGVTTLGDVWRGEFMETTGTTGAIVGFDQTLEVTVTNANDATPENYKIQLKRKHPLTEAEIDGVETNRALDDDYIYAQGNTLGLEESTDDVGQAYIAAKDKAGNTLPTEIKGNDIVVTVPADWNTANDSLFLTYLHQTTDTKAVYRQVFETWPNTTAAIKAASASVLKSAEQLDQSYNDSDADRTYDDEVNEFTNLTTVGTPARDENILYAVSERDWWNSAALGDPVTNAGNLTLANLKKFGTAYEVHIQRDAANEEIRQLTNVTPTNATLANASFDDEYGIITVEVPESTNWSDGYRANSSKDFKLDFTASAGALIIDKGQHDENEITAGSTANTNGAGVTGGRYATVVAPTTVADALAKYKFQLNERDQITDNTTFFVLNGELYIYDELTGYETQVTGVGDYFTNDNWAAIKTKQAEIQVYDEDQNDMITYRLNLKVGPSQATSGDATLSSVTVNGYTAVKSGNDYTVTVPEDTDLTAAALTLAATDSKVKSITVNGATYSGGMTLDLSKAATIVVTAENGKTETYTLTAKTGDVTPPKPDEKPSDKYTDIPNDVMGESIKKAIDEGIMVGTSATKFSPNMTVSRWQFALLIARADLRIKNSAITNADEADAELLKQYSGTPKFSDAKKEPLYNAAIEYCNKNGIIDGKGNNKFDPNGNVTRLEAARMISDWTGITDATKTENTNGVKDWNKVNWGKEYVNAVYDAGFITGYPNGNFGPKDNLKRSQAAVIIMKAYEYMTNK